MIKIKDCPFCGGEGQLNIGFEDSAYIECEDCEVALGWECSEEVAIAKWNKRIGCHAS